MLTQVRLGEQGLTVSRVGLGCMGMSQWYGAFDDDESVAVIHLALELGVTLFDSAEAYGPFRNEALLARALKGRRDKAVIATKFGFKLREGQIVGTDSRPEHIRKVVEESLSRLETDYIDILYQHRLDPTVPIEDVVGTMSEFVRAGMVRYIGLCEVGESTIRRAHAVHPLSVVQSEYSLWERNVEADILPTLRELGIGFIGFCPLGRGFLTGRVSRAEDYPPDDFRSHDPRLQGANYDRNLEVATQIRRIAERSDVTPAQLALAWVLAQGDDIVPIPGTKRRRYLQENIGAASRAIGAQTLAELGRVVDPATVAGPRYNERMMAMIDR
jgi:aryl-alcohol dehydrogenase-like predicted oxidoreductase